MRAVIATWNVHGWVGSDGARDPGRSFRAIRSFDADVVALQEVDGDELGPLAREAGYDCIWGRTRPVEFGNAVLVRRNVACVRRLDLSVGRFEPRGAIDLVLGSGSHLLRVAATHLGLRPSERRKQAAHLASHLREHDSQLPTVLVGDFNDWTPWAGQLRPLVREVGPLSRMRTFPSRRPILALDRIAWRAPAAVGRVTRPSDRGVVAASDHLALRLELCRADPR